MTDDKMLVRLGGGDVVRRQIGREQTFYDHTGRPVARFEEPELRDDEIVVQLLGDPIPLIIKTYTRAR